MIVATRCSIVSRLSAGRDGKSGTYFGRRGKSLSAPSTIASPSLSAASAALMMLALAAAIVSPSRRIRPVMQRPLVIDFELSRCFRLDGVTGTLDHLVGDVPAFDADDLLGVAHGEAHLVLDLLVAGLAALDLRHEVGVLRKQHGQVIEC